MVIPEKVRQIFACDVCGNYPGEDGYLEHGRGCYVLDADGGGQEWLDLENHPDISEYLMPEYTALVDVFPQASLQTALSFIKGQPVPKRDLVLAALNVTSYAADLFVKDDPVPMAAASPLPMECCSKEECQAALEAVLPDDSDTMKAGIDKGAWLTILKTLLPLILQMLG